MEPTWAPRAELTPKMAMLKLQRQLRSNRPKWHAQNELVEVLSWSFNISHASRDTHSADLFQLVYPTCPDAACGLEDRSS